MDLRTAIKFVESVSAASLLALLFLPISSAAELDAAADPLNRMSLSELSKVEVTSVSKTPELLRSSSASIYVITHDDLVRSGATSIPEALRLAPNLLVTQLSASSYTLSARGFGGNPAAQNFSNKLLMLIDGRSVYTPLFSGIYADAQDVMIEDIERIEVISGPGATLWGANAMNGVINVITRASYLSDGTVVAARAGSQERGLGIRYGGKLNAATAFRVYAKGDARSAMDLQDSSSARDGWWKGQGGFRLDWEKLQNSAVLQADIYRGTEDQLNERDLLIVGANVLTRWEHHGDHSSWQVQTYFDQTQRSAPTGGVAFVLHTYDFQLQQNLTLGAHHQVVWGAGERVSSYGITNSAALAFQPNSRSLSLANLFAQDSISVGPKVRLTVGIKLEDDPYSGWQALPDARVALDLNDSAVVWAAASNAIRSPTPFDNDVIEKIGDLVFLTGNSEFHPERVTAYEVGFRAQHGSDVSGSMSVFYNDYDNLRSIETASATEFLPIRWDNKIHGNSYGMEMWINWQINSMWRLSPSASIVRKRLRFDEGASGVLGVSQTADDPNSHASLTVSADLAPRVTFDGTFRYVASLPDPVLPSYCEFNARLGWQASRSLELSLSGWNLLHARHQEFAPPFGVAIVRTVLAEARWKFR